MDKRTVSVWEIIIVIFLGTILFFLSKTFFDKRESPIGFDQYIWQNFAPNSIEPPLGIDNIYEPLALKISGDIESQTGVSLEALVSQGGKVIFNFFYGDTAPITTGYCELVEVIILSADDKIIQDYFLRYTPEGLAIDSI